MRKKDKPQLLGDEIKGAGAFGNQREKTSATTETECTVATRTTHDEDVLRLEDSDFIIDEKTDCCNGRLFIGKDIADRDVYNKNVPFAEGLNDMQRNAVALHLGAILREYARINHDDQQAVNVFWHRKEEIVREDHGFMSKDIDAVMDVLRKNVEVQSGISKVRPNIT